MPGNTTKRSARNKPDAQRPSDRKQTEIPLEKWLLVYFTRHTLFCGLTQLQAELEADHLRKFLEGGEG